MIRPLMSKKMAHALSFVFFAGGIALLTYLGLWWPALLLAVGLPLALKHYLLGELLDFVLTLIIFLGLFISFQFEIKLNLLPAIFFTLGGAYFFFKEFFKNKDKPEPADFFDGTDKEE
ncbi:MAG: hypothetical protein WC371_00730, partial [Parachlamydiales bacterium]|jgi:predicted membrane protein